MPLLYPDLLKNRITEITLSDLQKLGVHGLLLDVDNTLTTHRSQFLDPKVSKWLDSMKRQGIQLTVVSNAMSGRVRPFAGRIGLRFISFACKPFPFGFIRGAHRLGIPRKECAAVGDQTFTDVIGARLAGVRIIQLIPIQPEHQYSLRFKRKLEKHILKWYQDKISKKASRKISQKNTRNDSQNDSGRNSK